MNIMVDIKDLCFSYDGTNPTIDHVSFQVPEGSYTAILGHNGSGKSTIAKLMIGLLEATEGEITIHDTKLTCETLNEVRENVGIVFQNPDNQFIGSTVRDDIAFGLENLCVDPNKMDGIINEYAAKVSMTKFLDHEPTKLSGGQKQRVAIAGILAMHPRLIILDEATSMLDPKGVHDINALVSELNHNEKMTILSITHDIEEAAKADQVILLGQGKVVASGTPDEILSRTDLLARLKLDQPFAWKVSHALKKRGHNVEETISQENLVQQLCQ